MKSPTRIPRQFWVKATQVRNGVKSYTASLAPIGVAGEIHVREVDEAVDRAVEGLYQALKAERCDVALCRDNDLCQRCEALAQYEKVR